MKFGFKILMLKSILRRSMLELRSIARILVLETIDIKSLINLYRVCSAEDILEKIYVEAKDKQVIVELGLGDAYTTSALLLACRDGVGHLWTVDWCRQINRYKRARKKIRELDLENYWSFYKGEFSEFPERWTPTQKIEFLFIDEDGLFDMEKILERYDPLISSDGVIYVHNVGTRKKTRKEVLSFCKEHSWAYKFENTRHGLAILKRK